MAKYGTGDGETAAARGIGLHLKLSLAREGKGGRKEFFGPGVQELLGRIRDTGSIQQAARGMGLSYVKALKILRQTEEGVGRAVLVRRKGGNDRGRSELTPFGARFLGKYAAFCTEAERELAGRFAAVMAEVLDGDEDGAPVP